MKKNINALDKKIEAIQRSTKTSFKFMTPIHDYLRCKSKQYYNWHLNPCSESTHCIVLIVFIVMVIFYLISVVFFHNIKSVVATEEASVSGTATIMNTNQTIDFTGNSSNVVINNLTKDFSGYAWSTDLGWLAFGTTDNPEGPIHVDNTSHAVSGKAKVLNTGNYIDFNASPNSSNVVIASGGVFSGYAWSDDIGWINFTGVNANNFTYPPTETTQLVTEITKSTATGNGTITDTGGENATTRGFKYGLTQTDTWSVSETGSFSTEAYSLNLTNLVPGTTYYIRSFATNAAGTTYGSWQTFDTIAAGPAAYLKFTTGSTTQTAGTTNTIGLTAYDSDGYVATSYTGTKSITFSGAHNSPNNTVPTVNTTNFGSNTSINFVDGISASANMILYKAEIVTIQASDGSIDTTGSPDRSLSITVSDSGATHVDFTNSSGTVTALVNQDSAVAIADLYVSALDLYDNIDTNYSGSTVTIAGGDFNPPGNAPDGTSPKYPTSALTWGIDDDHGVMYFDKNDINKKVVLYKAETDREIKAIDSILTNKNSNSFDIYPGIIESYALSASSPQTAGMGFTGTITAEDAHLNTVTTDSSTVVHMTNTGDASFYMDGLYIIPVSSYTLSSGIATMYVEDNKAQSIVITGTDINSKTGSTSAIAINAGSANHFVLTAPITAVVDTQFTIDAMARDAQGNTDTTYSGIATLSGLNDAPYGDHPIYGALLFTNGLASTTATGFCSGSQNITATEGSISGTSNNINFSALPTSTISITPDTPQSITAGETIDFVATQKDIYGNTATDEVGWTDTSASDSGLFNNTYAGDYVVYASANLHESNHVAVNVKPNNLDHINLTPPNSQNYVVGGSVSYIAKSYDQYNNELIDVNYLWHNTDGSSTGVISTTTPGIYTVSVTGNKNSISKESKSYEVTVVASEPTSISSTIPSASATTSVDSVISPKSTEEGSVSMPSSVSTLNPSANKPNTNNSPIATAAIITMAIIFADVGLWIFIKSIFKIK